MGNPMLKSVFITKATKSLAANNPLTRSGDVLKLLSYKLQLS